MPPDPSDEPIASPEEDGAPAEGTTDFAPTPRRSASSLSRFLELRLHARGGLGEVYEAWNAEFRRPVALKFLKPEKSGDGESRARFRGEAEITGRLEHPGIVPIYGMGEDDVGHPCYAMRFVRGLPMDEAIRALHDADAEPDPTRRDGLLSDLLARIKGTRRDPSASDDLRDRAFRELLGRFKSVCETVAYAHSKRVLHRDLKPQNVMLGKFGETLVVDWGLARPFDAPEAGGARAGPGDAETTMPIDTPSGGLTPTVGPKGTPSYMSPEQATARRDIGPATDIYSLGATLYSLLAGRSPFRGRADEVLEQVRDAAFPTPRSVKSSVPKGLEAVCLKAMSRDPRGRYASAEALADDVDNWLNDRPVAALREPWSARAGRWAKRHRTGVTASAAALVVGLAVVGAFAWRARGERLRVEADALASLEVAERLSADSLTDLAKWAAASSAAERAKGLLDSAAIGGDARRRLDASLARLRSQDRDRAMVHDLEEARLARAAGTDGGFDDKAQIEATRLAFRAYGIDLEALPIGEASGLVRSSAIRDDLIAAIDDVRRFSAVGPGRDKLLALARAADDDPGRGEIRDAIERGDRPMLVRLARAIDARASKPGRLYLLSRALDTLGEIAAAGELIARAQACYPDDFWVNVQLASTHSRSRPPRFEQSVRYRSVAVALRPLSAVAHSYLGSALRDRGDLAGAEAEYRLALALRPGYAHAHHNLGFVLSARGDEAGAEAEVRRAIALEPDNALAHNSLCLSLRARGDSAGAEAECRRALALDPNLAEAHTNLGLILRARGDLAGAEAECRRALALKPDYAGGHINLGLILRDRGDKVGGEAEYRRAIALEPDFVLAHNHLGSALSERGDSAGAEAECRRALALEPDSADAHNGLGNVLFARGDKAGAEAEYRRALALRPGYAHAHYNLGLALSDRGDEAGAEAEYRRAIALKPDYAPAHKNLGNTLRARGDLAGAEAEFRRIIALKPDLAEAHADLGVILRARGDLAGAEAEFRRAIALNPGYAAAYNDLGTILGDRGDKAGAEAEYRRALALDPDLDFAHKNLGDILGARGDHAGAEAEYRRAIALKPDDALAYCKLGVHLRKLGRLSEALTALRRGHELGSKQPNWRHPSAEWVRQYERYVSLEPRLPKVLSGAYAPKDGDDAVGFADLCYQTRRHGESARLYEQALTAFPKLSELSYEHRYNAACSAALAGAGAGADVGPLDDAARARWRKRALGWLRDDLAAWGKRLEVAPPKARDEVRRRLAHWKADADLAGLRDPDAQAKLPEAEREECRKLWADVEALLKKAEAPAK